MPRYEKIWMIFGFASLILFLAILGIMAAFMGLNPPDSLRTTVAPEKVETAPPFDQPGVYQIGPKEYRVVMLSYVFGYNPGTITIPQGSTVHFEATSRDVIHGVYVPGTNINLMLIPGHITEFTQTFNKPGEYLYLCHEYCGVGHHLMQGRIIVEPSTT
ncbi:MAG: cytochrome C oxidase subunit II [Bacillaceae bacterium]|nr:cytochrome C oxidase subunit II [Bacillaceae bacterium]